MFIEELFEITCVRVRGGVNFAVRSHFRLERRQVVVILQIELQHPRMIRVFGQGIDQCYLQRIPDLNEQILTDRFGSHREQLKHSTHTDTIVEHKTLTFRQISRPRQQIGE